MSFVVLPPSSPGTVPGNKEAKCLLTLGALNYPLATHHRKETHGTPSPLTRIIIHPAASVPAHALPRHRTSLRHRFQGRCTYTHTKLHRVGRGCRVNCTACGATRNAALYFPPRVPRVLRTTKTVLFCFGLVQRNSRSFAASSFP